MSIRALTEELKALSEEVRYTLHFRSKHDAEKAMKEFGTLQDKYRLFGIDTTVVSDTERQLIVPGGDRSKAQEMMKALQKHGHHFDFSTKG